MLLCDCTSGMSADGAGVGPGAGDGAGDDGGADVETRGSKESAHVLFCHFHQPPALFFWYTTPP